MNELATTNDLATMFERTAPRLQTPRLVLRAPLPSDLPVFARFLQTERSLHVRPGPMTESTIWRAFGHFIGHWILRGYGSFVITDAETGAVLGTSGPWFPAGWPERELGWALWSAEAEGKGIAFEAAQAARAHAYDTLGWDTAVSYIDPENARSRALAQRLGCTLEPGAAHPGDTPIEVWRHPSPGDLADGGMEAYA